MRGKETLPGEALGGGTHSLGWLSKCRALLVRYEKKAANYLGFVKVACILLW
jgi:hypothetical protein